MTAAHDSATDQADVDAIAWRDGAVTTERGRGDDARDGGEEGGAAKESSAG